MTLQPAALLLAPLLLTQGLWARSRTPRLSEASGPSEGEFGDGQTFRMAAAGDSIIAGVGVQHTHEALPARLAAELAAALGRNVRWFSQGANGARCQHLLALEPNPCWNDADLLLVSNGLNDITAMMPLPDWEARMMDVIEHLHALAPKALVAQLGVPPLRHFPALPQPLRTVLGRRAERYDRRLEALVANRPGTVYLPFRGVPESSLFAADGYHPGPEAVRQWAGTLVVPIAGRLVASVNPRQ